MHRRHLINFGGVPDAAGAWLRTRPIIPALLAAVAGFWLFGPPPSSGQSAHSQRTHPAGSDAAIERFWIVYHGNDYGVIPEVQAELQGALNRDPDNATLYALLGATHFWHIGEYTRDSKADLSVLQQDMPTAVQ